MEPKRLLVITNMGPTRDNLYQGKFVFRQVEAMKSRVEGEFKITVFSMPKWLGDKPAWFKYSMWSLFFLLTKSWRRYTHIHVHFFMPTAILATIYKRLHPKVRLFATFHGTDVYAYTPPSKRYSHLLGQFEKLIFVSSELESRLSQYVEPDRSEVLSAGIPEIYKPAIENNSKERRSYDYLFVGTLNHNKGADRLISLASKLPKNQSLVVVGQGPYIDRLTQLAVNNENIRVIGAQSAEELVTWYRSCRWLINLSRNESFGLVMAEAMACGTPVVATKTDGALEQIVNGQNGFVIQPDDTDQLFELTNITSDEWSKLSLKGIETASKHKLSHVTRKLNEYYT